MVPSTATILIVDDDEQLQRTLCQRALAAGLASTVLFEGSPVLAVAVEQQPSLILLDVELPGVDGRDVLRALKSNSRTHHIPVFVHTRKGEHSDRMVALQLGADDYFEKPFDLEILIRRILRRIERLRGFSEEPEAPSRPAAQPNKMDCRQGE